MNSRPLCNRIIQLLLVILFLTIACVELVLATETPPVPLINQTTNPSAGEHNLQPSSAHNIPSITQRNMAHTITPSEVQTGALLFQTEVSGRYVRSPLLKTQVNTVVTGMLIRTNISQSFKNDTAHWMEGLYVFPLSEDAVVDAMQMHIGEQTIVGEIQSRAQARKTYQSAKTSGRQTSLVERQRANLYTSKVANIAPGETVKIDISYQSQARYSDGVFNLRIPTTLTPRYIPGQALAHLPTSGESVELLAGQSGWAVATDQVADAADITPPMTATHNAKPVSITVTLDAGVPVEQITSSSHDITTTQNAQQWLVSTATSSVPMDRDFTLQWQPALGQSPVAAIFRQDKIPTDIRKSAALTTPSTTSAQHNLPTAGSAGESFASIMLMPPQDLFDTEPPAREVILVIDTSGSMEGDSIIQAKSALQLGVQKLSAQDKFNLIEFNDEPRSLFTRAVPANTENIQVASRWIRSLSAGGGTEIQSAMQAALQVGMQDDKRVRQIVFVTDGSVGNEAAIFEQLTKTLGSNRLFTVGIGSAPNTWFMRKASALGRGTYTYIGRADEVGRKMLALFHKLERPVLTGLKVQWAGVDAPQLYPQTLPDLYAGEPVLADARWGKKIDSGEMIVSGHHSGREWVRRVSLAGPAKHADLDKLWAARKIASLNDSLLLGASTEAVEADITQIGLQYELITRYTSLVAVAEDIIRDPSNTALHQVNVPAAMPAGSTIGFPRGALGLPLQWLLALLFFSLSILFGLATLHQVRQHAKLTLQQV